MRRFLLILLGLTMVFPAIARKKQNKDPQYSLEFQYTYEGQTLWYTVISREEKICMTRAGYVANYAKIEAGNDAINNLVIPSNVNDGESEYTVVSIGNLSFYHCVNLSSVVIPETVKSIGYSAFGLCYHLTIMNIPGSVTSIGKGAFKHCSRLKSLSLPKSLISIGDEAFFGL